MTLKDAKKWQEYVENNQQSAYGKACIDYAERWADLMEKHMKKGSKLEKIAQRASREANTWGMSGFQYFGAVQTLVDCWTHGEQLRRWHNLKTQVGTEGEKANEEGTVLNPALL